MALTLIAGPMFSGKTSALMARAHAEAALYKSDLDTRYSDRPELVSHRGERMRCRAIRHMREITTPRSIVLVDEAHLILGYPSEWLELARRVNLTLAMLSIGVLGPLELFRVLAPYAASIYMLNTDCALCGTPYAQVTQKISDRVGIVGGASDYRVVCERCAGEAE